MTMIIPLKKSRDFRRSKVGSRLDIYYLLSMEYEEGLSLHNRHAMGIQKKCLVYSFNITIDVSS